MAKPTLNQLRYAAEKDSLGLTHLRKRWAKNAANRRARIKLQKQEQELTATQRTLAQVARKLEPQTMAR